jgi:hypothetical protein
MEAFESFVAVALESEGFVVSSSVKFPVARQTARASYPEVQTHGYEVDLVAARAGRLVLATVKSFFGSQGVKAQHVKGSSPDKRWNKMYALLNDPVIRDGVIAGACDRYGYGAGQVELRLYVGKFAAPKRGTHEEAIRAWCAGQGVVGGQPIKVVSVTDVIDKVIGAAAVKQYRDNPVLVTMKVLEAAGALTLALPGDDGGK